MMTRLSKRTVVSLDGPVAGVAIACDSGAAWITQCCDSMDHILTAGMDFAARREGKIVVQVVKDAKISIRLRGRKLNGFRHGLSANDLGFRFASILRWGRSCRFMGHGVADNGLKDIAD
jgi:hypothetical protein